MTQQEIETLLDEKLVAKTYGEIAFVDNVPEISKLILASHLRSKQELLQTFMNYIDKHKCQIKYYQIEAEYKKIETELTKLNQ